MTRNAKDVAEPTWRLLCGTLCLKQKEKRSGRGSTKKLLLGDTTDTRTGHDVPSDISS
jgi:hypothetical protein